MKIELLKHAGFCAAVANSVLALGAAESSDNRMVVALEYMKPAGSRTFAVEYVGKISEIPAGTELLRVWMPVPLTSTVQSIRDLSFPVVPRLTTETKFGNRIAYWEFNDPGAEVELSMRFVCERKEVVMALERLAADGTEGKEKYAAFMRPERLVLVDDEIRAIARDRRR